jgi:hypothetical protein
VSKKYGGSKQGWGEGTPSWKRQRQSERIMKKSHKPVRRAKRELDKSSSKGGCALIILGVAGAVSAGVAALKGWA